MENKFACADGCGAVVGRAGVTCFKCRIRQDDEKKEANYPPEWKDVYSCAMILDIFVPRGSGYRQLYDALREQKLLDPADVGIKIEIVEEEDEPEEPPYIDPDDPPDENGEF